MNKVHNVIWSKVKGCYVVVSELVRFCKYSSNGGGSKQIRALLTVIALTGSATVAYASDPAIIISSVDVYGNVNASQGSTNLKDNYLYNYNNPGNLSPGWEGNNNPLRYGMTSVGGVALGRGTDIISYTNQGTYQSGIAIGDYAHAKSSFAVGLGAYSQATDIAAMAIGAAAKASGFNSLAMMRQSAATGEYASAIGTASWAKGDGSFAFGYSSTAKGVQSIAIGSAQPKINLDDVGTKVGDYVVDGHTEAAGDRSFAFGTGANTLSTAPDSIAIGTRSQTASANTLAIGTESEASSKDALAFGYKASSTGEGALSMGTESHAQGNNSFALGKSAQAESDEAIAIGNESRASGEETIAIGDGATVTGESSVAIGIGAAVSANHSIALGNGTAVNGPLTDGWSAFTNEINHNEDNGVIAVGNVGKERRIINVAGGENDTDAVNVKQLRYVNNNLAKTIAGDEYTGYEDNGSTYKAPTFSIAGNTYTTVKSAVEAAQTNYYSVNTSANANVTGEGSNYKNDGAKGNGAMAAGLYASAVGIDSVAVGHRSTANGGNDVAIGYQAGKNSTTGDAQANQYAGNVFIGDGAGIGTASYRNVALGAGSVVSGADNKQGYMVALGAGATAKDGGSVAIGGMAVANKNAVSIGQSVSAAKDSVTIGYGTQAEGAKSVVIGELGHGTQQNSVVLGAGSSDRAATAERQATLNGITYGNFAGVGSTSGGVTSIGAAGKERQLINVAAGHIAADSTDAINGSQLYATNTVVGNVANSVSTVLGGNATVSNDGSITTNNIGDTGKNTVHEAIKSNKDAIDTVNTAVQNGWELQYDGTKLKDVTPSDRVVNLAAGTNIEITGNDDTITISTSKEPTFDKVKVGDNVVIDKNSVTVGDTAVTGNGVTVTDGPSLTKAGIDGGNKVISNVADGVQNSDAVNKGQLDKAIGDVNTTINNTKDELIAKGFEVAGNTGTHHINLGDTVTIQGEGTKDDSAYSGENIKTMVENGKLVVKMDKNLTTDSVTTTTVTVGKDGADGRDGTQGSIQIIGKPGKDGTNAKADVTVVEGKPGVNGVDGKDGMTRIEYTDRDGTSHEVATLDDGMKYGGDTGAVIKKQLNEQVNVVGGITDENALTTEDNLGVISDGKGSLHVKLAKELTGLSQVGLNGKDGHNSALTGDGLVIRNANKEVRLTADGLDNGGNRVTNVAPGIDGTDAVNVNQLREATGDLANQVGRVDAEVSRAGAHAAAMAALKPLQYDPLEPTQIMAGIGNYRNQTAAALGIAHYTAEDTMFHVGVSVGASRNMINAGVTHKFGSSPEKKAIPDRYKAGPISSVYVMQDEIMSLIEENKRVRHENERVMREWEQLKTDNDALRKDNEAMHAMLAEIMNRLDGK